MGRYVACGGISGALAALRGSDRAGKVVTVDYELTDNTRAALLDGILTLVISHPLERLPCEVMSGMIRALKTRTEVRTFTLCSLSTCTRARTSSVDA
jgi:LacI family transcriptional regulator